MGSRTHAALKRKGMDSQIAVLLMAYGGPGSLDEVEPYLMDVRGGRPLSRELLEEIREQYRKIGGKSPLLELTKAQARALERELADQGIPNRTFVGMRHWHPYIRETVAQIQEGGFSCVVAFCLAPQYSELSVGAYFRQYRAALGELSPGWETTYVHHWHDQPVLLQAFAENTHKALQRFPESARGETTIVFTAHSLPERILKQGDPYDDQVKATAAGVAKLLEPQRWVFAYQSQGYSQEKWLGPCVEEVLQALAADQVKNVVVAPIGFVSDHVEILYDVDIVFRELAGSLGMRMERPESLNDNAVFIRAMADTIRTHLLDQQ